MANEDINMDDIEKMATNFDELCNARMQLGREKYGDFTWLEAPTFAMILEELADMVNYTRFLAVKLQMIQEWLKPQTAEFNGGSPIGNEGFLPSNPERS